MTLLTRSVSSVRNSSILEVRCSISNDNRNPITKQDSLLVLHAFVEAKMNIDSNVSLSGKAQAFRLGQPWASNPERSGEENLQDVFSAVLEQVGREGFESSRESTLTNISESAVVGSFEDWFDGIVQTRYSFQYGAENPSVRTGKSVDDLKQDFGLILSNAFQNGGYAHPQTFLQTLDKEQLATLQQIHHLADPIQLTSLSEEASLNLLLPPDAQIDADHDGLTAIGVAFTFRFPDSNTPDRVRDAWMASVEGLNESDRMLYSLQMSFPLISAKLHFDAEGNYSRSSYPGDADWTNPMGNPTFDYGKHASDWLRYLEDFKNQIPPDQYKRDHSFWTTFRQHLVE
jgi:hypothetical protein